MIAGADHQSRCEDFMRSYFVRTPYSLLASVNALHLESAPAAPQHEASFFNELSRRVTCDVNILAWRCAHYSLERSAECAFGFVAKGLDDGGYQRARIRQVIRS
jgi:hypothetical protein